MKIEVVPDTITIHPDRLEWKEFYKDYPFLNIKIDEECKWSDGEIGGYCTEFYKNGVEIGNIVNPLGTCIDVGFGKERLELFLGIQPKTRNESLINCVESLVSSGVVPGGKGHGYILRKLLRKMIKEGVEYNHPIYSKEKEGLVRLRSLYFRLKRRHSDKPPQWWHDCQGIDSELYEELNKE